ncbi:hypothetical protein QGP82_06060 [Leptothoe sp. LEGE 181152]|nr:hypothetical protein [Leptothoe sp. LEGE 181152]
MTRTSHSGTVIAALRYLPRLILYRLPLFLGMSGLIFLLACFKSVIQPSLYRETLTLLLNPDFLAVPTKSLSEGGQRPYVPPEFRDFQTIIELLESYEVIAPALPKIQQNFPGEEYRTLQKQLTIKHLPRSEIMEVSFQATSSEKVEQVLEALAEAYILYARKTSLRSIDQATALVEEQLPIVQARVEQLQEKLEDFRQSHNFYEPQQLSQQLSQQLGESTSEMRTVDLSIRSSEALLNELTERLQVDENLAAANGVSLYLLLLNSLKSEDQEQARLGLAALSSLDEDIKYPGDIVQLDNVLELLQAENDLTALTQQKEELTQVTQGINKDIQMLAYLDNQYTDLQRDLQISTDSLNRLLSAREDLQLELAKQVPPWEIISDVEEPDQPISSVPRTLVLGLFAGILVSLGTVLIADQFDETYRSAEELENDVDIPVLLRLRYPLDSFKAQEGLYPSVKFHSSHDLLDAFRLLETNLKLLYPDRHLSTLAISSADNTSTLSVTQHLALAFSRSSQRVLLIDANLRDSVQTGPLDHDGSKLADLLVDADMISPASTIELTSNLSLLPAGKPIKNPIDLFSANSLQPLLEKLQTQHDALVIDTPPIQSSAAARLISSQLEGLILVVRIRSVKQRMFQQLMRELQQCGINILGIVAIGSM